MKSSVTRYSADGLFLQTINRRLDMVFTGIKKIIFTVIVFYIIFFSVLITLDIIYWLNY